MEESLNSLLSELEKFGEKNDETISDRPQRMLNITRDTGAFLSVLIRATNARHVLEIGTSNGYSTLWLSLACRQSGKKLTTFEIDPKKTAIAQATFKYAGVEDIINLVH